MKIKLSIIIVTYNSAGVLQPCLVSLSEFMKNTWVEVILVDNVSTDDTCSMVERNYPSVRIIRNTINTGFGAANNIGMSKARGDYILLLNSDTLVTSAILEKCYDYIRNNISVGVLGCKLVRPNGDIQPSCGFSYSLIHALLGGSELNKLMRKIGFKRNLIKPYLLLEEDLREIRRVEWIAGAFMLLKKEVFEKTRGFDENIFLYYEEIEWCFRINKAGFNIFYYPHAKIVHLENGSTKSLTDFERYKKMLAGKYYFFKKHFGWFKALLFKNIVFVSAALKVPLLGLVYLFGYARQKVKERLAFQISTLLWYFCGSRFAWKRELI